MASAENYTQAPNFINPNNYHPQEERELIWTRFGKWALKKMGEHKLPTGIGVGALVGAVATSAVVGLSHDKKAPDTGTLYGPQGANAIAAAPVDPTSSQRLPLPGNLDLNHDGTINGADFDLMEPEAYFALVPEWAQLNDVVPKLHKNMESAYTNLLPHLSGNEQQVLSMPDVYQAQRSAWSDQDYLNYFSIGLALLSGQGKSPQQIAEGQRALPSIEDPINNDFEKVLHNMNNGIMLQNVYRAVPSPFTNKELQPGTRLDSKTITEEGGRLVLAKFISGNNGQGDGTPNKYLFFMNVKNDQGLVTSRLVEEYDVNDPAVMALMK